MPWFAMKIQEAGLSFFIAPGLSKIVITLGECRVEQMGRVQTRNGVQTRRNKVHREVTARLSVRPSGCVPVCVPVSVCLCVCPIAHQGQGA